MIQSTPPAQSLSKNSARFYRQNRSKPLATIQIDLDGSRTLERFYGLKPLSETEYILPAAIPHALELLRQFDIKATFFVATDDIDSAQALSLVRSIIAAGHELANHSASHLPGFARLQPHQLREQLIRAHLLLASIGGQPPVGFKAPNYELAPIMLDILQELDYHYDSSVFPTSWRLALRWLQAFHGNFRILATDYGGLRNANSMAYKKSYFPDFGNFPESGKRSLQEIPVTVSPLCRMNLPMHSSFLLALPFPIAFHFLESSLQKLLRLGSPLNFPLHAWEFAPIPERSRLFPKFRNFGLQRQRIERLQSFLQLIREKYRIVPTREMAAQFSN